MRKFDRAGKKERANEGLPELGWCGTEGAEAEKGNEFVPRIRNRLLYY